nr:immunoglobulin light chain junction region [Macaca mulatta]
EYFCWLHYSGAWVF